METLSEIGPSLRPCIEIIILSFVANSDQVREAIQAISQMWPEWHGKYMLKLETLGAVENISDLTNISGVDNYMIGLGDLSNICV